MNLTPYNRSVQICSHGTSGNIVEISLDTRVIQELKSILKDEIRVSRKRHFLSMLDCV